MITIDKFVDAVKEMRTKQNEYFRVRSPYILKEAKQAEAIVDNMLKHYSADQRQLSLFDK